MEQVGRFLYSAHPRGIAGPRTSAATDLPFGIGKLKEAFSRSERIICSSKGKIVLLGFLCIMNNGKDLMNMSKKKPRQSPDIDAALVKEAWALQTHSLGQPLLSASQKPAA